MKTISKITIVICFVFGILGIGGGLYFRNSDLFGCYCIGITGIILIIVGIISLLST